MEDLNPFAHVDAPAWVLRHEPEAAWIQRELQRLGLSDVAFATVDVAGDGMKQRLAAALDSLDLASEVHQPLELEQRAVARENLRMAQGVSKQMVLLNASHEAATTIMAGSGFVVNREGRVKNINDMDGNHLFSPRLVMEECRWPTLEPEQCSNSGWSQTLQDCLAPNGGATLEKVLRSSSWTVMPNRLFAKEETCSMGLSWRVIHG